MDLATALAGVRINPDKEPYRNDNGSYYLESPGCLTFSPFFLVLIIRMLYDPTNVDMLT